MTSLRSALYARAIYYFLGISIAAIGVAIGSYTTAAPGGVSTHLTLRMNASTGTLLSWNLITSGEIDGWLNNTVNNELTGIYESDSGDTATVNRNAANFNPLLRIQTGEYLVTTTAISWNVLFDYTGNTAFAVLSYHGWSVVEWGWEATGYRAAYFEYSTYQRYDFWTNAHISSTTPVRDTLIIGRWLSTEQGVEVAVNGTVEATGEVTEIDATRVGPFAIWANPHGTFDSDVSVGEYIIYNTGLTATQIAQVETYLAVKYGITYTDDYIDSSGNIVRDYSANSWYSHDIAWLGRDDASPLLQEKSRSINTDSIITISGSSLDNQEFLLRGNDSGSLAARSGTNSFSTFVRLPRQRTVVETGHVGTVRIMIDESDLPDLASNASLYLFYDTDADLSDATVTGMIQSGSTRYIDIDLDDGNYFTFATDPVTVSLQISWGDLSESNGLQTATITALLSGGTSLSGLAVMIVQSSGTASTVDYTLSSGTIWIAAGATSWSVSLAANSDTIAENIETFTFAIDTVSAGSIGSPAHVTGTITSDNNLWGQKSSITSSSTTTRTSNSPAGRTPSSFSNSSVPTLPVGCEQTDYILMRYQKLTNQPREVIEDIPVAKLSTINPRTLITIRQIISALQKLDTIDRNTRIHGMVCKIQDIRSRSTFPTNSPVLYILQYIEDLAILIW